jgi:hypothetical protein
MTNVLNYIPSHSLRELIFANIGAGPAITAIVDLLLSQLEPVGRPTQVVEFQPPKWVHQPSHVLPHGEDEGGVLVSANERRRRGGQPRLLSWPARAHPPFHYPADATNLAASPATTTAPTHPDTPYGGEQEGREARRAALAHLGTQTSVATAAAAPRALQAGCRGPPRPVVRGDGDCAAERRRSGHRHH